MIIERLLKVALLGSAWVLYLMIALSVLSVGAAIERIVYFARRRGGAEVGDTLVDLLKKGDTAGADAFLASHPSVEAQVVARAVRWVDGGADAFADALSAELLKRKHEIDRGMNLLGTLGSNAPFIGLFGTVIGVIEAFHQLGAGQDKAAMSNVMAGIAEALVATGVGLVVAIPAVVAYNIFQKQIESIETNIEAIGKQISALLKASVEASRREHTGANESGPRATVGATKSNGKRAVAVGES